MRRYLTFTVFAAGMATLAAELSASRLLGNVFGTSNLVWASIIGLILMYLTAGYFIGGRWADRSPYAVTMYRVLAWGAFSMGVVPYVANPVLRAAADAFDGLQVGVLLGAFVGVLVLFIVPITLLGTISPFAIRISLDDPRQAGTVAGRLYAVSTLGSFVGTFLPVLVFMPTIGVTRTFLVFSLFLLTVALIGLGRAGGMRSAILHAWMPLALILLDVFLGGRAIKSSTGQIYETESAYNYIQVLELDGYRYLRLNEGQGVHSVYHPDVLNYYGPWEQFLAGSYFNPAPYAPERVERIAIVGLAAGTTARQATAVYGPVPIDGWEIDPRIVDVGRVFFDMTMPNLNVIVADGRWGLERSPHRYDLIAIDAYRPPYIPAHLTSREFFQIVFDHLDADGALAINVGRAPGDRRLIDALATTIATVFPSVYVVDIPATFNSLIFATRQPTEAGNLRANLDWLSGQAVVHPLLLETLQVTAANLQPGYGQGVVFTDDRAPIEWITNDMVVRFLLSDGMDTLE